MTDIAHRTIDSPVGPLLLAAVECEGFDTVLETLAAKVSPAEIERSPR